MLDGIELVIELAHDHSLETRIRVLIDAHLEAGAKPRMVVMNEATRERLMAEVDGFSFTKDYLWVSAGDGPMTFFLSVPIVIKDYIADMEVIVGVD